MKFIKRVIAKRKVNRLAFESLNSKDVEKLNKWMAESDKRDMFGIYGSMRRRAILETFAQGIEGKEYWKMVGRMEELQYMLGLARKKAQDWEKTK